METNKKSLTRKDLLKSWLIWTFFSHSCYNYERLQALAFAHSMTPIIKKLYDKKEEVVAALKRHLVFFNTEPNVGSVIHGITIAMEEERANGAPISDEAITSVKTSLMGPLAGIGDTITQGILAPILIAFGVDLAKTGNLLGPVFYALLIGIAILGIAYFTFFQGYRLGKKAVEQILEGGLLKNVISGAGIMGATVIGALTAKFVSVSTPVILTVGQAQVKLQDDVFNKIMPGLLPLLLTLLVLRLLRRGNSPTKVMLWIVVIGIVGSLVKFF
ncbi:MAG: PTS system mannose/fructose/sorbose family transporter subunit IID [Candidatus Fermentithermobacillus carboniphilus]|uniref:PTS system mannose/fructose/sorbose family transporter subunit IID n=1 Tax=Candidatus Fermentithermobacillus carboniphilus TaxID=3085328 RepID=A0AAT9LHS1_9FIRM|nr:MAG: PTS system mannose/fructose/sorbose family transporter subunit IID [Candidatus Fermentithermobacillus carboniphilus]